MGNPFAKYQEAAPAANPFVKYAPPPEQPQDDVQAAQGLASQPKFYPRGRPSAETSEEDRAASRQHSKDFARYFGQSATFNYSDEAIAGVRAAFGEDFAKALDDERKQLIGATERLGGVDKAAAIGLSMLMPMGPVAKGLQKLIGPGATTARQLAVMTPASAAIGGVAALGATDNKAEDGAAAVLKGAAIGAVIPAGTHLAMWLGKGVKRVADYGVDAIRQGAEFAHSKSPGRYTPLNSTTRYATTAIADASELGGMRTPTAVGGARADMAVPDTPSALVNLGNDRLNHLAGEQAMRLKNPNVPRVQNGNQTERNVWLDLVRGQGQTRTGQTQSEAFKRRLFDDHQIPTRDRSDVAFHAERNAVAEQGGQRIAQITATPAGQRYAGTTVNGFSDLVDNSPEIERMYNQAASRVSIPGSPDSIVARDAIPLPRRLFDREQELFQNGRRATAPVLLTDGNVPMPILVQMRQQASAMTQEKGAAADLGRRINAILTDAGASMPPRSRVAQFEQAQARLHGNHSRREDFETGRAMLRQNPNERAKSVADTRRAAPQSRDDRRLGMLHGIADDVNKNSDNIGALSDAFSDPAVRRAYDEVARRGSTVGASSASLSRDLRNVGDMQDVGAGLLEQSRRRSTDTENILAQAARFYVKYAFQPGAAQASVLQRLGGMSQARRAEIARLLTDRSGEGFQRLNNELNRRIARRNLPPGLSRLATVVELSRLLGETQAQKE